MSTCPPPITGTDSAGRFGIPQNTTLIEMRPIPAAQERTPRFGRGLTSSLRTFVSVSHGIERPHEGIGARPPASLRKVMAFLTKKRARFLEAFADRGLCRQRGSPGLVHRHDSRDQLIPPIDQLWGDLGTPQHLRELLLGLANLPSVLVHLCERNMSKRRALALWLLVPLDLAARELGSGNWRQVESRKCQKRWRAETTSMLVTFDFRPDPAGRPL
jgi:hypothetical protein